ncbi:MAG: hybrid sensor histidine kinase/response regulator [Gammaproteobacteria bacterium]|nr:MAG: hybrid sensor histidine kinase/response regulator [Gammaproteobacteria bacterium]
MVQQEISQQRILVVDDTPKNIQVIGAILREKEYLISIASSGQMALEAIEKSVPDLVLLDIMMPEMDGYEVCERIKSNPETEDIPVIFLSAITETLDKVKAFGLGAVDYITKPIEAKELLARVDTHLKIDALQKELKYVNKNLEYLVEMRTSELQVTQSYLANVINSMPSIIIGIDLNGDIINLNHEAERTAALLLGDVIRRNIRDAFPDYAKYYDEILSLLKEGKLFSRNKVLIQKKPNDHFFDIKTYPLFDEDEIVGGVLRIDDVTEVMKQDKLKTKFEREKMAALGEVVIGVAHEINTPVGGALTAISALKQKTAMLDQLFAGNQMKQKDFESYLKEANEFEGIALTNINRASEIISQFKGIAVDYARYNPSSFYLKERICLLLETMSTELKEKKCSVDINCPDSLEVTLNKESFDQIMGNLLTNSLIHGFDGIEGGIINIDIELNNDALQIVYSDNGPGIPLEDEHKLFTPFFTTKRGSECVGLGLSIVYNLITLKMEGKISFTNTKGKGLSFKIELPQVD